MYILISIILITLLLTLILLYPFKITIFNDKKYLFIKISFLITLKLNIDALFNEENKEELVKQSKSFKIIKKLKFNEIDLYLSGINYNYSVNGAYYGLLCAFFPIIDNILESSKIKFNYLLDYDGELYLKFKSIVRARTFNVVKAFYGI